MNIAIFLSALFCSALAAPQYSYPAPAVGLAEGAAASGGAAVAGGAAAAGGAASGPVVGIVKDDRVVDESGSYSFDVAGEDGTARQESGAPLAEGGISQTGSYSYTQDDGTVFELKYVADTNGFQPESSALPALPQFVLEQIEFAKNNPEPEGAAGAFAAGEAAAGAAAGGAALAAPGSSYLPPSPVAPESSYLPPTPVAPESSYLPPSPVAPESSYLPPSPVAPVSTYFPPSRR